MAFWRFLFVVALAFGSVIPDCVVATPVPVTAHHAGMAHDQHQPSKAHVSDACIGCATPVRFTLATGLAPMVAASHYAVTVSTLTTYDTTLDPPPPRLGS
jgi:hypothetical protein